MWATGKHKRNNVESLLHYFTNLPLGGSPIATVTTEIMATGSMHQAKRRRMVLQLQLNKFSLNTILLGGSLIATATTEIMATSSMHQAKRRRMVLQLQY